MLIFIFQLLTCLYNFKPDETLKVKTVFRRKIDTLDILHGLALTDFQIEQPGQP